MLAFFYRSGHFIFSCKPWTTVSRLLLFILSSVMVTRYTIAEFIQSDCSSGHMYSWVFPTTPIQSISCSFDIFFDRYIFITNVMSFASKLQGFIVFKTSWFCCKCSISWVLLIFKDLNSLKISILIQVPSKKIVFYVNVCKILKNKKKLSKNDKFLLQFKKSYVIIPIVLKIDYIKLKKG